MISLQDYIVCKIIYILVMKFFPGIPESIRFKNLLVIFSVLFRVLKKEITRLLHRYETNRYQIHY